MKVKNCILRKSGAPKIECCGWDFSAEDKRFWIVVVYISTGSRKFTKYYSYKNLQDMLTGYMDSIDADENDPDRDLQLVVIAERYSVGQVVTYEEAEVTIICRKIYWQDLVKENIPQDAIDLFYKEEDPHRMFVGEVVEIIKK